MTDMSHHDRAVFDADTATQRVLTRTALIAEHILDVKLDKPLLRKYALRFSILYAMTGVFWYVVSNYVAIAMAPF